MSDLSKFVSKIMDARLQEIIRDSMLMGARSFRYSQQEGLRTVRILLEPEKEFISRLSVFISYASTDLGWAREVRDMLQRVGFCVNLIEPSALVPSRAAIEERLISQLDTSDYLCLLFSKRSAARDWVRFEFNLAASQIGRVVLIKDESVSTIEDFGMRTSSYDRLDSAQRVVPLVQHSIVEFNARDPEMALKLAREIINNPDEGVTDGTYRPLVIRERDLRREARLRRLARIQVHRSTEFSGKYVIAVLPFFWNEIGVKPGDLSGVFDWFVEKHGRLNMRYEVHRHGTAHVSLFEMPLEEAMRDLGEDSVSALVLWKEDWNREREMRSNNVIWQI